MIGDVGQIRLSDADIQECEELYSAVKVSIVEDHGWQTWAKLVTFMKGDYGE